MMEQIMAQYKLSTHLLKNVCKDFSVEQTEQIRGDENHVKWLVGQIGYARKITGLTAMKYA